MQLKFKSSRDALHVAALWLFAMFVALSPHTALAQTPPPPPVFQLLDPRGVDVVSGDYEYSSTDVSIGAARNGLAFVRTFVNTAWRHNYLGLITQSGTTFTVSIGGSSETFTQSGGTFTSNQARGSTLALSGGIYTYLTSDGAEALFDSTIQIGGLASITQLTLPDGARTTFHYKSAIVLGSTQRRLQSVTNNFGYQLHFEYALNNPTTLPDLGPWRTMTRVTAINNAVDYCDPLANACGLSGWPSASYARSGVTETVTDPLGRVTQFGYTSATGGVINSIRFPSGGPSITIVRTGTRVSSVYTLNGIWQYVYADSGGQRTTTVRDPLLHTRTVVSNLATSRVVSDTDPLSRTISYQYDANNRLTRTTMPEGNYTQLSYDARGNVTEVRQVAKSGSGLADIVTSASYPASCSGANFRICNQPATTTDARGFVTDYTYDAAHGGVLSVTAPDPDGAGPQVRPQTRFSYTQLFAYYKNASGVIVAGPSAFYRVTETSACATLASCANGADETRTLFDYGAAGVANNRLPIASTARAGDNSVSATLAYTYDTIGNRLTIDGPLPGSADTTRTRYDAARQTIGLIGPDPDGAGPLKHRAQRLSYNGDGQVVAIEQGTVNSQSDPDWAAFVTLERANIAYDQFGRQTHARLLDAGGAVLAVSQQSYDAASRLDCVAARMNQGAFPTLPSSACTQSPLGDDGPDQIVRYGYNNADQLITTTSGYGTANAIVEATTTYTSNGLQQTLADGGGNLSTFVYDGHDRLRRVRFPQASNGSVSSSTDYEEYSYDAASNVTQVRLRDAQNIAFSYDNLDRMSLRDAPGSANDVAYGYDNFSRQVAAGPLSYAYDQLSRPLSETQALGIVSYQYDAAGRRTRMTWPDAFYVTYDYDLTDALTAVRENGASSGPGVLATFAYDNLGRRTGIARGNGTSETTTYDALSRLRILTQDLAGAGSDDTRTLSYDGVSDIVQRVGVNAAYNTPAPSAGTTNYADNGLNQYTSVAGATPTYDARGNLTALAGATYGYDALNRLTSAGAASLAYDAVGRLRETIGAATTRFLYDGARVMAEYNGANILQRRYVHGAGLDEPIVWYEGAGVTDRRWLVADERGSIVAVTNASGAVLQINTYDEYGAPGASNLGRFQYTGQMWIGEAQLYHYRARAYLPALGRFAQADPILYAGGMNLYAYVGNDPINAVDPWGLQDPDIIVVGQNPGAMGFGGVGGGAYGGNTGGTMSGDPMERDLAEVADDGEMTVVGESCGNDPACWRARLGDQGIDDATWDFAGFFLPGLKGVGFLDDIWRACSCFEEGTLVATRDGLRPIEQIQVGDQVLAWNPDTGETTVETVTALIRPEPKVLWRLEVRDAGGETEIFHVTDDHPWYVEGVGWVETQHLAADQRIETADDRGLLILDIARTDRVERTYNLTVSGPHTFLVGEDGAVVHNGCERILAQLVRDFSGRLHGALPRIRDLSRLSRDQLQIARGELRASIAERSARMRSLGELGGHGSRLSQERRLLEEVERLLGP